METIPNDAPSGVNAEPSEQAFNLPVESWKTSPNPIKRGIYTAFDALIIVFAILIGIIVVGLFLFEIIGFFVSGGVYAIYTIVLTFVLLTVLGKLYEWLDKVIYNHRMEKEKKNTLQQEG